MRAAAGTFAGSSGRRIGGCARARAGVPRGFTLFEVGIVLVILMTASALGVSAFVSALAARKCQDRRAAARELVALSLERARALPAESGFLATPATGLALPLPEELSVRLRGARCLLFAKPSPLAPGLMRIQVEVHWSQTEGPEGGEIMLAPARSGNREATP